MEKTQQANGEKDSTSENFRKLPIQKNSLNEDPSSLNEELPRLNEKQWTAVEMLLAGKSLGTIARVVGVTPRTLYTWRQEETFRAELARRRREIYSATAERLRALIDPSLDVIEEQLHDPYDRARVRAAQTILRFARLNRVSDDQEE